MQIPSGKPWRVWLVLSAVLTVLLIWGSQAIAAKDKWPKRFDHKKGALVMYQPQLEDFKDDKITGYAAVSYKKKGWKAPRLDHHHFFGPAPGRSGDGGKRAGHG